MTDAELLALVQTHTPAELQPEEVAALRERRAHSPALQQALAEHGEMERFLAKVGDTPAAASDLDCASTTESSQVGRAGVAARGGGRRGPRDGSALHHPAHVNKEG